VLYDNPDVYDALFHPGAHLRHYQALADEHPGSVLEVGCGTGQLTAPLGESGRRVVGVDLSRPMLDAAKRRATAARVKVEFVEGDMRSFDLNERFALVFIARNSMLHLSEPSDFVDLFATVRRHLTTDGIFAFDIFNPDVRILAQPRGQRVPVMTAPSSYGDLTVEATSDYDVVTQVNRATWYISTPSQRDAWTTPLHLRSIFPQELVVLLAARGFSLISRAGNLAGAEFSAASNRQVCLCRAS
jgi:SAM-dependent methyltransferase